MTGWRARWSEKSGVSTGEQQRAVAEFQELEGENYVRGLSL
jgi:hypothetical protein